MSVHTRREITWKVKQTRYDAETDEVETFFAASQRLVTSSEKRYRQILAKHPDAKVKVLGHETRWREGSRNRSRTFDRRKDADAFDANTRRASQLGEEVPARIESETLENFYARDLAVRQHSKARRTLDIEKGLYLAHIHPYLGFMPLRHFDEEGMERWQTDRLAAGAGAESIAKSGKLLSRLFKKAVRQKKMTRNPMDGLEKPKVKSERVPPASVEQVERIRAWFLERDRLGDATLVSLMAYGTLRVGEALALQCEDFSQGDRLWISHSLEDDGTLKSTKTETEGLILLPGPVAEDLLAWRRESGIVRGLFFPRAKDGMGWTKTDRNNWNRRYFKPACEAAGLVIPPKNLRHTSASLRIASGKRPTEVAEEMRHSLAVSIDVYQRLMREFEGQPVRPMDDVIRDARLRTYAEHADAKDGSDEFIGSTQKERETA
jgi:integrase